MRKTMEAIDEHLDAASAYVPVIEEAVACSSTLDEVSTTPENIPAIEETIRDVDPDVLVMNSHYRLEEWSVTDEYPVVHVRHGASVGRGEETTTTEAFDGTVDLALAPGEQWANHYRTAFDGGVGVSVVGIPEADDLVGIDPPGDRRALYAPTNHNYGGGSYVRTAEHVLDIFAGSDWELLFRPHPMDRIEEPGKSVTETCRDRIANLPNVTFDTNDTPRESVLSADLLLSDYSGIVTEWLHTGRPLVQLTDIVADRDLPDLGYATDDLSLDLLDELYEHGYPMTVENRVRATRSDLGIPMDGRAGERAAREVIACAQ